MIAGLWGDKVCSICLQFEFSGTPPISLEIGHSKLPIGVNIGVNVDNDWLWCLIQNVFHPTVFLAYAPTPPWLHDSWLE